MYRNHRGVTGHMHKETFISFGVTNSLFPLVIHRQDRRQTFISSAYTLAGYDPPCWLTVFIDTTSFGRLITELNK